MVPYVHGSHGLPAVSSQPAWLPDAFALAGAQMVRPIGMSPDIMAHDQQTPRGRAVLLDHWSISRGLPLFRTRAHGGHLCRRARGRPQGPWAQSRPGGGCRSEFQRAPHRLAASRHGRGRVIVELKATERIAPFVRAQIMSYLRVTSFEVALMLQAGMQAG